MRKKNNKIIKWFIEEGALKQEGNFYIAERAFRAHSFINWIKEASLNNTLNENEIEKTMLLIRMFLQNKINLKWKNGIINVFDTLMGQEESHPYKSISKVE